jgi:DNA-binding NtrC family response regulator
MTGLKLAEHLRAVSPNLRVIITTGYTPETSGVREAGELGITCLPKPFLPEALPQSARRVFEPSARAWTAVVPYRF